MKFTIEIDCTPEEAREFFGLPKVADLQAEMMEQVQKRMADYFSSADAETLAKTWLPGGIEAWQTMQQAFLDQFAAGKPKKPAK